MLTLGDVLTETDIGLDLVVGGDKALTRPVIGAHSMEADQPNRWLEPDWIMLTTGMRLRDAPPREYRRLVREVSEGSLSALGFGIGMVFDDVPAEIIKEAKRRNFPIFTVPVDSQFRTIIDYVHCALASENAAALQRSLSLQRYLINALPQKQPREDLISRLTTTLRCDAAIIRYDGRVQTMRGKMDVDRLWSEITVRDPREQIFELDEMRVLSFPLLFDGRPIEWLVVTTSRTLGSYDRTMLREVAYSAARMLESLSQSRRIAALEEQAAGSQLLDRLIKHQIEPADSDVLRAFGFNLISGARVAVVIDAEPPAVSSTQPLINRISSWITANHVPHLIHEREGDVVMLLGAEGESEHSSALRFDSLIEYLRSAGVTAKIGVGRVARSLEEVSTSAKSASLALARIEKPGGNGRPVVYGDNLGLAEWVVHSAEPSEVEAYAHLTLQTLKVHPDLYETLRVYLAENLNVKSSAHALGLHPNTMRYRLARIEELLDRRLEEALTITDLSLAMLVDRSATQPR